MSNVFQRYLEEATISRSSLHPAGNTLKFHREMEKYHTEEAKKKKSAKETLLHFQYAQHHRKLADERIKSSEG